MSVTYSKTTQYAHQTELVDTIEVRICDIATPATEDAIEEGLHSASADTRIDKATEALQFSTSGNTVTVSVVSL